MKFREAHNFQDIKDDWVNLMKYDFLGNNIFSTWEWLSNWWKHFGEKRDLLLLNIEDEEEIIAIAPLMLSKYKLPIFGYIKKIEFLGTGTSDYNNFIVIKREEECLNQIIKYLVDAVNDWDWIELKDVPETVNNFDYLESISSNSFSKLKLKKRSCNICPYLPLPNSYDRACARRNLRRNMKNLKKDYPRIELKTYQEYDSVKEAMNLFIDLHEKRWKSQGQLGSYARAEPSFKAFHMDVAESFSKKGWLGLYFLTVNDEPIAAEYNFNYRQKIYSYQIGFDPNFAKYSPGNLIRLMVLKKATENGFKEYDLMRGNEAYKQRWTNMYRKNSEMRLIHDNLVSEFRNWLTWDKTLSNLARKFNVSMKKDYL